MYARTGVHSLRTALIFTLKRDHLKERKWAINIFIRNPRLTFLERRRKQSGLHTI